MWFVYRFARDVEMAATRPVREIDPDVAEFSNCIVQQVAGRWVAASARAPDGGVEVWYNLAYLPSEAALKQVWAECLSAYALTGKRITNR
jgi:uncharacterized protein (DUF1684 family)